jgi:hypothetical protein
MRLISIALALLLGIVLVSTVACSSNSTPSYTYNTPHYTLPALTSTYTYTPTHWYSDYLGANPTIITESRIDGEFTGWSCDTVFHFINGQTWQQASCSAYAHPAAMPRVVVYSTSDGYKMYVEGTDRTIFVRRVY